MRFRVARILCAVRGYNGLCVAHNHKEIAIPRLRFGIKTAPQHTTYDAMLSVWREAGATSVFEHAWLFDHFAPIFSDLDGPCFEGWTLLPERRT